MNVTGRVDDPILRTVVLGGGVAGLGLAHGLGARGLPVQVLERSQPGAGAGFGLLLMPNGLRALTELGCATDFREVGVELRRAVIRTSAGELLSDAPLDGVVGVTRHALLSALRGELDQTAPGAVRCGAGFDHFEWEDDQARAAVLDDGTSWSADVFCGADGIRSACRAAVMTAPEARPGRVKEVVAVTEDAALAAEVGDAFLKFVHPDGGLAVGLVPAGGGRTIWFVQFDSFRFEAPSAGDEAQFLADHLSDFPDLVRSLTESAHLQSAHTWHTVDMDPVDSMVVGNVALVGDAAHPLLPFTSQGANSALEDAAELVRTVELAARSGESLPCGLRRYGVARRREAVRFVAAGRALAADFVQPPDRSRALPMAV